MNAENKPCICQDSQQVHACLSISTFTFSCPCFSIPQFIGHATAVVCRVHCQSAILATTCPVLINGACIIFIVSLSLSKELASHSLFIACDVLCFSFFHLFSTLQHITRGSHCGLSSRRQVNNLLVLIQSLRKKQISTAHQIQRVSGPLVYLRWLVFPDQILLRHTFFQS